jgi:hypothetical protein
VLRVGIHFQVMNLTSSDRKASSPDTDSRATVRGPHRLGTSILLLSEGSLPLTIAFAYQPAKPSSMVGPGSVKDFIAHWRETGGSELANSQSFINGICALIDVSAPDGSRADDAFNNYVLSAECSRKMATAPPASASSMPIAKAVSSFKQSKVRRPARPQPMAAKVILTCSARPPPRA